MAAEKSKPKKSTVGGARPGAGRKRFAPDENERRQVELLAGLGIPVLEIAAIIRHGIDYRTLRQYFGDELAAGRTKANAKVAEALFKRAIGGDTTACIWWTKARMGWSDTQKLEHTSPDGSMSPAPTSVIGDAVLAALARKYRDDPSDDEGG